MWPRRRMAMLRAMSHHRLLGRRSLWNRINEGPPPVDSCLCPEYCFLGASNGKGLGRRPVSVVLFDEVERYISMKLGALALSLSRAISLVEDLSEEGVAAMRGGITRPYVR